MSEKTITYNKKAGFEYHIIEKFETGIQLVGTEVKSLRDGKCNLAEGYVTDEGNELFLKNVNIPEYSHGNINNHEPNRKRKLLLHKKEILQLKRAIKETGITVIPLKLYFKGALIKLEIGIGKGKKLFDKRETIKQRDDKKRMSRELKNY